MLLWGRPVPRLSLTSLGSIQAGAMGCTAPRDTTRVGQGSQPSWCFHLSPSQNTHPPHYCALAGLHISLSLRQLVPGHPTILIFTPAAPASPPAAPPGRQPQAKSSLPSAWHCTNPAWHPHTSAVLVVPRQGHS